MLQPKHPAPAQSPAADKSPLAGLFAPLDFLLAAGGDTRLAVSPKDDLNGYGCRPTPRPEAFTFASSTATSISGRAYRQAGAARERLLASALDHGEAIENAVEGARARLLACLGLTGTGVAVVFSPSGTDSQLHALFCAQTLFGGAPLTSIVVASDETGSGTRFAVTGRHFSTVTALGAEVSKGEMLAGMDEAARIDIAVCDGSGRRRAPEEIDSDVIAAVARETANGRKIFLQTMDRSKLWRRAPSRACLDEIATRWPDDVQIAADICQLRASPARIAASLGRGEMVLITGSKFFTGPPFSGALLLPPDLAERLSGASAVPKGLRDYSHASDWPREWDGLRAQLRAGFNAGQWLRWEAALAEMEAYFAVPLGFRTAALRHFSQAAARLIDAGGFELTGDEPRDRTTKGDDQEFTPRTILPFVLRRNNRALSCDEAAAIYRALNRDVSADLPANANTEERRIAAQLCHIGQPVPVRARDGSETAVLRISAGARIVSESWCADAQAAHGAVEYECDQVRRIVAKINLLLRHQIGG